MGARVEVRGLRLDYPGLAPAAIEGLALKQDTLITRPKCPGTLQVSDRAIEMGRVLVTSVGLGVCAFCARRIHREIAA